MQVFIITNTIPFNAVTAEISVRTATVIKHPRNEHRTASRWLYHTFTKPGMPDTRRYKLLNPQKKHYTCRDPFFQMLTLTQPDTL